MDAVGDAMGMYAPAVGAASGPCGSILGIQLILFIAWCFTLADLGSDLFNGGVSAIVTVVNPDDLGLVKLFKFAFPMVAITGLILFVIETGLLIYMVRMFKQNRKYNAPDSTATAKQKNNLRQKIRSQGNYLIFVDLLTTIFEDFGAVFLIFLVSLICFETTNDDLLSTAATIALYATTVNCGLKTLLFFWCCCDCGPGCCCAFVLRTVRSFIAACVFIFCIFLIIIRRSPEGSAFEQYQTGGGIRVLNDKNNFDYQRDGSIFLYQPITISKNFDVERYVANSDYFKQSVKNACGKQNDTTCETAIQTQNCKQLLNRISIGTLYSVYGSSIKDTFVRGFGIFRSSYYKIPCSEAFPYLNNLPAVGSIINPNDCNLILTLNTTQKRPNATVHIQAFLQTHVGGNCQKIKLDQILGTVSGKPLNEALGLKVDPLKKDITKYSCGTDSMCSTPPAGSSAAFSAKCKKDCGEFVQDTSPVTVTFSNQFYVAIHKVEGTFASCKMHYILNGPVVEGIVGHDTICLGEDYEFEEFEYEEKHYAYPQFITACN